MPQSLTLEILDAAAQRLRERAARNSRTAESEAALLLTEALLADESDPWAAVDALREDLAASGRVFPDSTPLIREDRER